MPIAEQVVFKEKFIERYSQLTDWETFRQCSLSWLRKSIRVNTLKISVPEVLERLQGAWKLDPIPWCKEGFFIEGVRRDVGNLPGIYLCARSSFHDSPSGARPKTRRARA